MGNKLFIDSNYFISLYNPSDSQNQKAEKLSHNLENFDLYISNFIFLETVTVFSQRVGRKLAVKLGNRLLESESINLIQVDTELQKQTWRIFCDTQKKNTSFVDCSTVAVMQAEGIDKLLTFDREDFKPLLKKHHLSLF